MMRHHTVLASLALFSLAMAPVACTTPAANKGAVAVAEAQRSRITEADVIAAQNAWGDALVAISTEFDTKGYEAAKQLAGKVLDTAYGYNLGPVLFKPTLTEAPQTFRTTRQGALAYFVGGDPDFPKDTGFALKHWRSYKIANAAIFIDGNTAISMGNVMLTDKDGNVTTVDKTWGYLRDEKGNLRIVLHHSSLPYSTK